MSPPWQASVAEGRVPPCPPSELTEFQSKVTSRISGEDVESCWDRFVPIFPIATSGFPLGLRSPLLLG